MTSDLVERAFLTHLHWCGCMACEDGICKSPTCSCREAACAVVALVIEECVSRVELHDKPGRDWIPGSLWDQLTKETAARIRALAPTA